MSTISDVVNEVMKEWNRNVEAQGHPFTFDLKVGVRNKKSYINKKDFYETRIAEVTLYQRGIKDRGSKDILLWRQQRTMPPKVKHTAPQIVENDYIEALYKQFLYECVGNFCVSAKQLILTKDWAEYDIENDRLAQTESAVDMIVQTIEDGPFYKKGDEFDVFMVTDNYYAVYTQHDIGLRNNGIAEIKLSECMIIQNAKVKIILDI